MQMEANQSEPSPGLLPSACIVSLRPVSRRDLHVCRELHAPCGSSLPLRLPAATLFHVFVMLLNIELVATIISRQCFDKLCQLMMAIWKMLFSDRAKFSVTQKGL